MLPDGEPIHHNSRPRVYLADQQFLQLSDLASILLSGGTYVNDRVQVFVCFEHEDGVGGSTDTGISRSLRS